LLSRQNLQMAHEEKRSEALTQPQGIGQHGRERAGVGAPAQSGRRHSEPTLAKVCSWPNMRYRASASQLRCCSTWMTGFVHRDPRFNRLWPTLS